MVAKVNISTPQFTGSTSVTVPSGTQVLVVRLGGDPVTPTAVTFNSVAMLSAGYGGDGNVSGGGIYYLSNPDIGTFTLDMGNARTYQAVIDAISNTSGVGSTDFAAGFQSNPSQTLATSTNDLVLDVVSESTSYTPDPSQTVNLSNVNLVSATEETATGASTTMSWSGGGFCAHCSIVLTDGAPPVSISQADTTPEDGVQQTVTCTGMTGPITAATLGGTSITLSGTDPSVPITYTLDVSALAVETNASLPRLGIPLDLVFTTATDGPVTQSGIVIQPKTGWSLTELEDPLVKDPNSDLYVIETEFGITITSVDSIYYDMAGAANVNVSVNGVRTSNFQSPGDFNKFIVQTGATSPSLSYSDNFYPYGQSSGGGGNIKSEPIQSVQISSSNIQSNSI